MQKEEVTVAGDEVDCGYEGEDSNIRINCVYLKETIKAMKTCEKIRIAFTDPGSAITIKGDARMTFFIILCQ